MNLFEKELMLIFEDKLHNKLDVDFLVNDKTLLFKTKTGLRIKIYFHNSFSIDNYDELILNIKNLTDGTIDTERFAFDKVWGRKKVRPDFDVSPHIWTYGKTEWYGYTPTQRDRDILATRVLAYVEMYE